MPDDLDRRDGPRWSQLYETAAAQEGHFTTAQAAEAGYWRLPAGGRVDIGWWLRASRERFEPSRKYKSYDAEDRHHDP